jgi:uncharacterized protein
MKGRLSMIIAIEKAKPGMQLLEDVLLPSGAVLLNATQILTASLIETIVKRGISKIQVVLAEEEAQSAPENPKPSDGANLQPPNPSHPHKGPDGQSSIPRLKVLVSKDAMSAKLCVEPSEASDGQLRNDTIIEFLNTEGVIFGIDEKAVAGAIEKWNKFKRYYEIDNIAVGTPPMVGKEGSFDCIVQHISDPAKLAIVKSVRSFRDFAGKGIECKRVDPGMEIARKQDDHKTIPGTTVKGDSIFVPETTSTHLYLDATVEFGPDRKKIVAKATGIVYFLDSTIGICPINYDSVITLSVSPDKMKAEATILPPGEKGVVPSRQVFNSLLGSGGIVYGVMDAEIDAVMTNCSRGIYPAEPVPVAMGTPPLSGENGTVEFLFPMETSLKPKVNKNGMADYKDVNLVASVKKGQEIARLRPPGKGTPGKNILGQVLPCIDGSSAPLPMGPNTEPSPHDPRVLVATTDGLVKYNGMVVEVNEGFFIKGNIDFSTGNVNYVKSVVVGGDITSGFKVQCGGDLQVTGTIEDADIVVGGNVLCKLGFIGQGKGVIDAKGDVNLAFMKNQTVKSRQHIVIAKEALHCTILARKSVVVHGNPHSIAGGKIMARDSITAYSIGNDSGVKTLLEVGVDFSLLEELEKTESQLTATIENRRKLTQTSAKYQHVIDGKTKPTSGEESLIAKLKVAFTKLDQQIAMLEERKKIVVANVYEFKKAHIVIEHAALPGTVFKIGARMFQVKEEIIGPKTVRLIDEEIRII